MKRQAIFTKDQKETVDWKNKYLRALADYQNLEKRIIEARSQDLNFATKNFFLKIVPVIDDLEKAEKELQEKGLTLIINKLMDILKSETIEKIGVLGKKFDPHMMECIEVDNDEENEVVTEELRSGYTMHGKVIRATQVKVGKKKNSQQLTDNKD